MSGADSEAKNRQMFDVQPLSRDELLQLLELADTVGGSTINGVPGDVLEVSMRLFARMNRQRIQDLMRKCKDLGSKLIRE